MEIINPIVLGHHYVENPCAGMPDFLSAASALTWTPVSDTLTSVGDDQNAVVTYRLAFDDVIAALRANEDRELLKPGRARKVLPGVLPDDNKLRKRKKHDFEGGTVITRNDILTVRDVCVRDEILEYYPHGMLLITGSGGMNKKGKRSRSTGVVFYLDRHGHVRGGPTAIDFTPLHVFLDEHVIDGELNLEGVTVHNGTLLLAQRGNSVRATGEPAQNLLLELDLSEFFRSLITDLSISAMELQNVRPLDLGYATIEGFQVKYDITDVEVIAGDPRGRLVVTGAAEADFDPIDGVIGGSVVGMLDRDHNPIQFWKLADSSVKLEGIDARYTDELGIVALMASDADDPNAVAPLYAATLGR